MFQVASFKLQVASRKMKSFKSQVSSLKSQASRLDVKRLILQHKPQASRPMPPNSLNGLLTSLEQRYPLYCCLIPSNFFLTTNRIRGLGILLTQSFTLVKLKAPAHLNSGKKPYWRFLWAERYKQSTKAFSGSAMRKFPSPRYQSNPAKNSGAIR